MNKISVVFLSMVAVSVTAAASPLARISGMQPLPTQMVSSPHDKNVEGVRHRMNEAGKASERVSLPDVGALRRLAADKTHKLDSVVCTVNSTGEKVSLQTFRYDEDGLPIERVNSLWDPDQKSWYPVEVYGFIWDDDEYCQSQWVVSEEYGYGQRFDYTYNDRKLGDSQVISNYIDGEWVPDTKGEYLYDEYGNIVDEHIYSYDGSDWLPVSHTVVSFDASGRQLSYENSMWNGSEYEPFGDRMEYAYNEKGQQTLWSFNMWEPETGSWLNWYRIEQEFNDAGLIMVQENKYWNKSLQSWAGVEDYGLGDCFNTRTDYEYDDLGRETREIARRALTTDGYKDACEMMFDYTATDDGGTQMYRETFMFDEEGGNRTLTGKLTKHFDKDGRLTFVNEKQIVDGLFWCDFYDEYYSYDERGNMLGSTYYIYDRDEKNTRYADIAEEYLYDDFNNIVDSYYYYGAGEDEWVPTTRFTYAFERDTIRVEKLAYMWNGEYYSPNWGDGVVYDFATPWSEVLMWPTDNVEEYKIDETRSYIAYGDDWDYQSFRYHYSELSPSSVDTVVESPALLRSTIVKDVVEVIASQETHLDIYGINGQLILSSNAKTVDVSHLAPGIYIAVVNGKCVKIVKE